MGASQSFTKMLIIRSPSTFLNTMDKAKLEKLFSQLVNEIEHQEKHAEGLYDLEKESIKIYSMDYNSKLLPMEGKPFTLKVNRLENS